MKNTCRALIAATITATLLSVPCLADEAAEERTLTDVLNRLDALADQIEKLDQRILRLERMLIKRPVHVDGNGIIRDDKGRPVGIWGIDAGPTSSPAVPKR